MARKRTSDGFNVNGFEGVVLGIELGEAIGAWRDRYCSTVGLAKSRRAAGWAVDETATQAVANIRWRFHSTLKRRSSWTQSAVAYKRLSKADLSALERGERSEADVFAQVYVKPKQSTEALREEGRRRAAALLRLVGDPMDRPARPRRMPEEIRAAFAALMARTRGEATASA